MEVPQGMDKYYPVNVLLLIIIKSYGLKQAAAHFWKELLKFRFMKYTRNQADPCLYFIWVKVKMVILISWVDYFLLTGNKKRMKLDENRMMSLFECEELAEMKNDVNETLRDNSVKLALLSLFCMGHNPTRFLVSNKAVMLVNRIISLLSLGY